MSTTPLLKVAATATPMAASATPKLHPYSFLCVPSMPLCHKFPILALPTNSSLPTGALSLRKLAPLLPLVARTSDWAQQQQGSDVEDSLSDWEGESGDLIPEGEEISEGEGEWEEEGEEEGEGEGEGGEDYREPPEEAKLFVGNLPYNMDSQGLANLFEKAGIVEIAEVVYERETDRSRGFGFVTMSNVKDADKAIEMFNRYELNGRFLTVNKASPKGTKIERSPREINSSFKIYVGNLQWQVDGARLERVFSEHGKVLDAKVVYDRETGRSRGFGFVTMSSQEEVNDAIAALDGQNLDGRTMRLNLAETRPRSPSF